MKLCNFFDYICFFDKQVSLHLYEDIYAKYNLDLLSCERNYLQKFLCKFIYLPDYQSITNSSMKFI